MSTANAIPETWHLTGDDARETLKRTGRLRLLRDAFKRLRSSDGFSHARSIGFLLTLLFIEGVIALVGLASVLGSGGLSDAIVRGLQSAAPGPAGRILTDAVAQAHRVGSSSRYVALWGALAAAIVTGTTLLGQFERAMNRIYGIERDRPTLRKYGNAFVLLCSAGILGCLGFLCLALGNVVGTAFQHDVWATVWGVARWPAGLLLIAASTVLILRRAPNRHQPDWSWLSMGAALAVALWVVVTVALGVFFSISSTFGQTYGPLAGIVALLLWTYASSVAVLFGVAVAAQLEAIRAGAPAPQSAEKAATAPPPRGLVPAGALER
jgi:YihY family inner membrane protein